MSFSILPEEIKIEIFNLLSISNRYNASLVWREMSYETWRSIPTVEELKRRLTDKFGRIAIQNLDDLEKAGVLAAAQNLVSVKDLFLQSIDVTNVPINIVNSLAKVVEGTFHLKNVRGTNFAMLENINCETLSLQSMPVPTQINQEICVPGRVTLNRITSDISEFFDSITCQDMEFYDIKWSNSQARSLTEMLNGRVRNLRFNGYFDKLTHTLDPSILANYDGLGHCESMFFEDEDDSIASIKEYLSPWAASKGWIVTQDNLTLFEIKRATQQH